MSAKKFELCDRVSTGAGGNMKQGLIAFVGETQFSAGEWIGIVLDSPEGKNDGSVAGVQYFDCEPNFGLFVKAAQVKLVVGQPPPSQAPAATEASTPVISPALPTAATAAAAALSSPAASAEKDTRDKLAALREKRKAREAASSAQSTDPPALIDSPARDVGGLSVETESSGAALLLRTKASDATIANLQRQLETKEAEHTAQLVALNKKIDSLEASASAANKALLKDKEGPEAEKMREMQNQILDLMDTVEMMTLDKEQLIVDNELLEESRGKLKAQVVSLTAELEAIKPGGGGGGGGGDSQSLVEENAKLREALKRLHDVSSQDKRSALNSSREAESSALLLNELQQYKITANKEIAHLKTILSESKPEEYEAIIEKLSERNQVLGEQKRQLEITVGDFESAQELMDELDVSQRAEIDRLSKWKDSALVTLLDKDQAIKMLEDRLEEMKDNVSKVVQGMHSVKDESDALKMKLQMSAEELLESSSKLQTTRTVKQELETLLEELRRCKEREVESESFVGQYLVVNARFQGVFENLSLWSQEKDFLAREVHAVSLARRGSNLAATRRANLQQAAVADKTAVMEALAILDGARQCWTSAAWTLVSSANSNIDTASAQAAFSEDNANALLQLVQHVSDRNILSGSLQASTAVESWISISFLLSSIELFSICIPKIAVRETVSSHTLAACKSLEAEVATNLFADALCGDIPHNMSLLSLVYGRLLAVVKEPDTEVEAVLRECLAQLRGLKVLRGVPKGGSLLSGSLVTLWATDPSSGLSCEWVRRVETLRGLALQQEADVRKYLDMTDAYRVMQLQYEMREEEARAAMARAEELRKMLDKYAGTSDKGDLVREKRYLEEIKTLTDALEVMEQRNESVERELKKKGKTTFDVSGVPPAAAAYVTSAQCDNSMYWRKIALQRMMQTLPILSAAHSIPRSMANRHDEGGYRGTDNVVSSYRAARKQRALIRVRSMA